MKLYLAPDEDLLKAAPRRPAASQGGFDFDTPRPAAAAPPAARGQLSLFGDEPPAPVHRARAPRPALRPPPGGGWRPTPRGWARGSEQLGNYEWRPYDWQERAAARRPDPHQVALPLEAPRPRAEALAPAPAPALQGPGWLMFAAETGREAMRQVGEKLPHGRRGWTPALALDRYGRWYAGESDRLAGLAAGGLPLRVVAEHVEREPGAFAWQGSQRTAPERSAPGALAPVALGEAERAARAHFAAAAAGSYLDGYPGGRLRPEDRASYTPIESTVAPEDWQTFLDGLPSAERAARERDALEAEHWDALREAAGKEPAAPAAGLPPALTRKEIQARGMLALGKSTDLHRYGYTVITWVSPVALRAAQDAGGPLEQGAQIFEYVPREDGKPRYTAATYDEQVAVHRAIGAPVQAPADAGPAQRALFGEEPKPERPRHGDGPGTRSGLRVGETSPETEARQQRERQFEAARVALPGLGLPPVPKTPEEGVVGHPADTPEIARTRKTLHEDVEDYEQKSARSIQMTLEDPPRTSRSQRREAAHASGEAKDRLNSTLAALQREIQALLSGKAEPTTDNSTLSQLKAAKAAADTRAARAEAASVAHSGNYTPEMEIGGIRSRSARTKERLFNRTTKLAHEHVAAVTEQRRLAAQIEDIESGTAARRQAFKEGVDLARVRAFHQIKPGDKVGIGGNNSVTVQKKNRLSIITEGGSKWSISEVTGVFGSRVKELLEQVELAPAESAEPAPGQGHQGGPSEPGWERMPEGGSAPTEPVTVRPAAPEPTGAAIPPRPIPPIPEDAQAAAVDHPGDTDAIRQARDLVRRSLATATSDRITAAARSSARFQARRAAADIGSMIEMLQAEQVEPAPPGTPPFQMSLQQFRRAVRAREFPGAAGLGGPVAMPLQDIRDGVDFARATAAYHEGAVVSAFAQGEDVTPAAAATYPEIAARIAGRAEREGVPDRRAVAGGPPLVLAVDRAREAAAERALAHRSEANRHLDAEKALLAAMREDEYDPDAEAARAHRYAALMQQKAADAPAGDPRAETLEAESLRASRDADEAGARAAAAWHPDPLSPLAGKWGILQRAAAADKLAAALRGFYAAGEIQVVLEAAKRMAPRLRLHESERDWSRLEAHHEDAKRATEVIELAKQAAEDPAAPRQLTRRETAQRFWAGLKPGDRFTFGDVRRSAAYGDGARTWTVMDHPGRGDWRPVRQAGGRKTWWARWNPDDGDRSDDGVLVEMKASAEDRHSEATYNYGLPIPVPGKSGEDVAPVPRPAQPHELYAELEREYGMLEGQIERMGAAKAPRARKLLNDWRKLLNDAATLPHDAPMPSGGRVIDRTTADRIATGRWNLKSAAVDYLRGKIRAKGAPERKAAAAAEMEADRSQVQAAETAAEQLPVGAMPPVVAASPAATALWEHLTARRFVDSYTIPDYPIGRGYRGQMKVSVEHKPAHGYRVVRQTTDRNGKWNKPHGGTYSPLPRFILEPQGDERGVVLDITTDGAFLSTVTGETVISADLAPVGSYGTPEYDESRARNVHVAKAFLALAGQRRTAAKLEATPEKAAELTAQNAERLAGQLENAKGKWTAIMRDARHRADLVMSTADPDRLGSNKRRNYDASKRMLKEWGFDPDTGEPKTYPRADGTVEYAGKLRQIQEFLKRHGQWREFEASLQGTAGAANSPPVKTGGERLAELERMQAAKAAPRG